MKKILVLLIIVICAELNGQIPPNPVFLVGSKSAGYHVDFFSQPIHSVQEFRLNVREELISATEVALLPGFEAYQLSHIGETNVRISQTYLNPVSFHPNGWDDIGLYEKFEVGVKLPPNILAQIESFLNGGPGINPYDKNQIYLKGTYSTNVLFNVGFSFAWAPISFERQGFYYREISLNGENYTQSESNYPFRIRFAPANLRPFKLKLELFVNGSKIDEISGLDFKVVDHGHKAFLSLNNAGKLKDSRGGTVFGIGQAMGYVENPNNTQIKNSAFNEQRSYINDLADNSGNLARIRLDPMGYDIEWEELGVYGSNRKPNEQFLRQYHSFQLDKTFDLCSSRGIYLFLTLMQDQTLTTKCTYGCGSEWPHSPYSSVVSYPENFLSDAAARYYFRQKLDYVYARWGYSSNLAILSLMNEANGVGDYGSSSNTRISMQDWNCEMAMHLKSHYPPHLVTSGYNQDGTSYSTDAIKKQDNTFSCPAIDIATCNHYSTAKDVHKERHDEIPKRVSWNQNKNIHTLMKPFIFGELGMTDCNPASDENTDAEFHNSVWSTSFYENAIGNGLYWYDWSQKVSLINHRQNFKALANFFNEWTISTDNFKSNWSFSGSTFDPSNRKIEYIEAVNFNKTKGYGWVKNSDYYWLNDPYRKQNWPVPTSSGNCVTDGATYSYSHHNENIQLHGFIPGQYYKIDIWSCYGNGGVLAQYQKPSNIFGTVWFNRDVSVDPYTDNGPDFAYKIYRNNQNFRTTNSVANVDTIYLNYDSPCIQVNSFEDDSINNGNHIWDFGNGKQSTEANPRVCYSKEGLYHITHDYKDSSNTVIKSNQDLYVIFIVNETDQKMAESLNNLALFPNPSTNILHVRSDKLIEYIYIYNQIGELVAQVENIRQNEFELKEFRNFKAGVYYLKISYGNNELDFRKCIKM